MPFQISRQLHISGHFTRILIHNRILTSCRFYFSAFFLHSVINLHPTPIVNTIVVVAGTGNCCRIKIRIFAQSCGSHKPTSGMSENTHFGNIYKRMAGCQLFNSTFIILQSIIAHIAITVPMVCFPSHRASSPVSYSYHDKAQLRQTGVIGIVQSKRSIYIFKIGSRINRRNNRITTGGIKISRFPHHTV